jgi:hypothetical protein
MERNSQSASPPKINLNQPNLLTNTMKNSYNSKASITARSGVITLLYTALFSLSPAATISLIGDHKIADDPASSPAEAGDLTVAGDFAAGGGIDFGALPTPGLHGVMMTYNKANRAALLDLTEINGLHLQSNFLSIQLFRVAWLGWC